MADISNTNDRHPVIAKVDARRHRQRVKAELENIAKVNYHREGSLKSIKNLRMQRFYVMDEAGQPMVDIQNNEKKELDKLPGLQKRKAVLGQSGVLKYLQPFYENTWNHKLNMSTKQVKQYVSYELYSIQTCSSKIRK